MSTTRTWIGGGRNNASDPNDWSPTGAPQPGDTLQMVGPSAGPPPNYTMNVDGNALAGNTLTMTDVDATINLAKHP